MALGAAQLVTDAGVIPSYAVPAASDTFAWPAGASYVLMHVKNANAAECVVAVTSRVTASDGLAVTNKSVTVPLSTGDRMIRISPAFRASATNLVTATFSVQSSVSVAILYY